MAPAQGTQLCRKREYDVVVPYGQEPFLALLNPASLIESLACGAVTVAAGIVDRMLVATGIADVEVPTQGRRSADLYGTQEAVLRPRQGMIGLERRSVLAEQLE